jgi:transcriptional/translational regulatory protein YebC/TACO1
MSDYTPEERSALAKKGNAQAQKRKRTRRAARDILLDILASDSTDKDIANIVMDKGVEGTELATLLYNMTKKASKSAQMAEVVFKLSGDLQEQPAQNITIVNQLSDEQLQRQINELRGNDDIIDVTPEPPDLIE